MTRTWTGRPSLPRLLYLPPPPPPPPPGRPAPRRTLPSVELIAH
ncbi:hypothetical protein [Nocardia cyriacigeorgica]|nr:hypothetical protein [Nocardia cyriacigeorgica]